MEKILLPSKIVLEPGKTEREASLVIEPLVRGYGITIGNAIRRVLLSSLSGAAVVSFKVKGAPHEFTSIAGVKEDVMELMLNMKQLRLKMFSDEEVRLHLKASGEGVVTASQIDQNADVEIVNGDLKIATLSDKKAEIEMDIFVRRGLGYVPVEDRLNEKVELGVLAVDSLFTPVKEVSLKIEEVRVGQITNFDKLIMNIETDGTVSPKDAVDQTLSILLDHFQLIAESFSGVKTEIVSEEVAEAASVEEIVDESVDEEAKSDKKKSVKKKK